MEQSTTKKTGIGLIGAILLLNSFATASLPAAAATDAAMAESQTISTQMTNVGTGATIIDSSARPDDLSHAANNITAKVKEALAANQKVILMLGEIHGIAAHVRLAEMVRDSLHRAGIENPLMAQEANYRFLESSLPDFFPGQHNSAFRERAVQALATLKEQDQTRYHHVQAMALAAANWYFAPITRFENLSAWIGQGLDIRLIDLAKTADGFIDIKDPATGAFVDANASPHVISKAYIQTSSDPEGIRLRNLWMAKELLALTKQTPVIILQMGLSHLVGNSALGYSYEASLHSVLSNGADKNVKIITVFPEINGLTFDSFATRQVQQAMDNADMTILRGLDPAGHWLAKGSGEEEIHALARIFYTSERKGTAPTINHNYDFPILKARFISGFQKEIKAMTRQYAPVTADRPAAPNR